MIMETNSNNILKSTGNNIPFSVPENYFENFAAGMDASIQTRPVSIRRLVAPWMYMAAMFVGLFVIANVFYSVYQQRKAHEAEMYELYVTSQTDPSILFDYYNEAPVNEEKQLN